MHVSHLLADPCGPGHCAEEHGPGEGSCGNNPKSKQAATSSWSSLTSAQLLVWSCWTGGDRSTASALDSLRPDVSCLRVFAGLGALTTELTPVPFKELRGTRPATQPVRSKLGVHARTQVRLGSTGVSGLVLEGTEGPASGRVSGFPGKPTSHLEGHGGKPLVASECWNLHHAPYRQPAVEL